MSRPTENELKILQVLWSKGPSTVRDVHEVMNEDKDSGYTTTLKLMQIMTEKGLTTRDTSSRTHIYEAVPSEKSTKTALLKKFILTTFGGSASNLVMQALGEGSASNEELSEIKDLIAKIEKDRVS